MNISGRNSEIIATIIDRQFIVSSPTRQYLKFVSSAGLRLDLVSQDDFGKYYVRLDTVHNGTLHTETRWVALLPPGRVVPTVQSINAIPFTAFHETAIQVAEFHAEGVGLFFMSNSQPTLLVARH